MLLERQKKIAIELFACSTNQTSNMSYILGVVVGDNQRWVKCYFREQVLNYLYSGFSGNVHLHNHF
jgi:hypothetical protein